MVNTTNENAMKTSTLDEAPGYVRTLIRIATTDTVGAFECGLVGINGAWFITWEGEPGVGNDGIRFGAGETEEASVKAFEESCHTYRLYHYQEGKPIAAENWDGQMVGVYYDQDGVRGKDPLYGLTYDLEHQCVVRFPEGPVTLLQLNELVQALNTLTPEATEGVELLHMELGTPPLKRLGYKKYPDLGKEIGDDQGEDLFAE